MTVVTRNQPPAARRATGLVALVDYVTVSHARAIMALAVLALVAFLPGFFQVPPVDRDEARFAQASKQMIESGDYVDIRFQDETRYKKPVGIYWLQASVVMLAEAAGMPRARTTIALYRLPSLLGAIGAVIATYWAALALVPRRAAILAAVMMAVSILLGVEARLAKTDAVLLFTCVVAMGALGRAYLAAAEQRHDANPWRVPAAFWTAMAGGVLVKGPLILLFVGVASATLVALDRSARWLLRLKPIPGMAWMLILVLPWFLAIISRSGLDFFAEAIGHDLVAKIGSAQEAHGAPPGTYFVMFWLTFFPASMLAALAAPAIWATRREPATKFLLAWIVPSWIVFEIAVTKLPHYVLPLYPAIAILIAGVLDRRALSSRLWLMRGTVWWLLLTAVLVSAIIAAPLLLGQRPTLLAWPFAAGAVICAFCAWWLYDIDGPERSLLRAVVATILIFIAIFGVTLPRLTPLFPAAQIARTLRAAGCVPTVATTGYDEPSLVFFAGTVTRHTDGAGAADFLYPGGCRFALIESRHERAFVQRADEIGLRYIPGPRLEAFNFTVGTRISIAIFRAERLQ